VGCRSMLICSESDCRGDDGGGDGVEAGNWRNEEGESSVYGATARKNLEFLLDIRRIVGHNGVTTPDTKGK